MTQNTQQFDWLAWGLHADWNAFQQIIGTTNEQIYKDELAKQPRFEEEGHPSLTLIYIGIEEDRYEEGKQALSLYLFDKKTGRGDFYQMSLSDSYIDDRNNTGVRKTGYQATVEKLAKVGFKGGDNFQQFAAEFFGKDIPCWIKSVESKRQVGKTYYVIGAIGVSQISRAVMPWNFARPAAPAPAPMPQQPAQQQTFQQPAPQPAAQPQNAFNANPYQQPFQQPMQPAPQPQPNAFGGF